MNLEEYFTRLREMAAHEKRRAATEDPLMPPATSKRKPSAPDIKA